MACLSRACCLAIVCGVVLSAVVAQADNWPRFRGPNGAGSSDLKGVPTTWTQEDYEWVVELPGKGHSSPVIWDELLFVTTGKEDGSRTLLCLNAITGETIWSDTVQLAANHLHKKNSYASGTPALDAQHVYVAFADEQHYTVSAYTHGGERVWTRDLGTFTSQHGQGVSPMIYKDLVIVPNDQKGPSQVVAFNAKTGEEVWTTKDRKFVHASYSTPISLNVDGRDQIISLSNAVGISALDPQTGEEIWASGELPQRTVGSPIFVNGLLIASCGSGGVGRFMVAVDPSGRGDVSQTHVKGERVQNLPYVPTPLVRDNSLFLWNDNGVVCCVDATGDLTKNVWRERVGGNYSGSPVMIDNRIYCVSEEGDIAVIDASPEYHLYGKSPLGDASYATPAVAHGRVYFRGFHKLACLKARNGKVTLSQ